MAKKKAPITLSEQEQKIKRLKDDLRAADKVNYREQLTNHICLVKFTKTDGTERVMKCTLKPDLLPPFEKKEENQEETSRDYPTVIPVFDLDKSAWRSFRIDSLIDFEVVD